MLKMVHFCHSKLSLYQGYSQEMKIDKNRSENVIILTFLVQNKFSKTF